MKEEIRWYIKHRTKIWSIIFLGVGLFGGNIDRIKSYLPSLNYNVSPQSETKSEYKQLEMKIDYLIQLLQKSEKKS